jgi:glycerol-3-phosphate dehydrogenase
MNVSGLRDQQRLGAELLRDHRVGHLRRRHRQRQLCRLRDLVDDHEADVVPRLAVFATGIANPTISSSRLQSAISI